MRKIVLKENIIIAYPSKNIGIEAVRLDQLVVSLSLFLSLDVHQVPFEPAEPVQFPFVVYQFYKVCNTKDQKVQLGSELKNLIDILSKSGYFLDVSFQQKKFVS